MNCFTHLSPTHRAVQGARILVFGVHILSMHGVIARVVGRQKDGLFDSQIFWHPLGEVRARRL